jgi:sulfonate transport system permease protein
MTIALRRELADTSEAEGQPSSDTSAPDAAPSVGRIIDLSHTSPKDSRRTSRLSKIALRAGGPLLILVIWQLAYSLGLLNKLIFASPGTVFASLWDLATTDNQLGIALEVSLRRAALGLLLGMSVGISLGLVTGLWRIAEQGFDSTLQMLRTIPFIALGPLFIVWFGLGEEPKILLVAAACVFPNYLNTYSGVRNVDPKLLEAGRVMGLTRRALIFRVVLPTSLPAILTGVRYSMGVAILALVFAEQINASAGIGYILSNAANNTLNINLIFACITIYAILGILIDLLVRLLERVLLPWRPSVGSSR